MHNDKLHSISTDWSIYHTKPLKINFVKDGNIMDKYICANDKIALNMQWDLQTREDNTIDNEER